jgi:signal transduction histidine kinase
MSDTSVELENCVGPWAEVVLSWADTVALIDIVRDRALVNLKGERDPRLELLIHAALSTLKVDIATNYILRQAEEVARHRDKTMASQHLTGRFLANASHELRTPLTAVLGFSELLLEENYGELNEEQRTVVGHIENSAQNLLEIVNNILDLMQVRAGKLEPQYRRIAVTPLLRHIFTILVPLSKRRKVEFRHQIPDDLGSIEADEGIVRHIIYHLLESALRSTAADGEVILSAERSDKVLTIITYDTALHFPPETIQNMNDAYPILENSPSRGFEGWEIGLPLVRRYVDLHLGTLEIESTPERGTTIRVHIPTHRPSRPDPARRTGVRAEGQ